MVSVKLDSENTTMYSDYIHARSIDSDHHPSRDWVKKLHATMGYMIPEGWRVCGENLYAVHTLEQNRGRERQVPETIIRRMFDRVQPPTVAEAHSVRYFYSEE
ncbi:MAG: RNA ligase family protein [Candidatus Kapaibacterium sp.]